MLAAVLVATLPWLAVAPAGAAAGRCEEGTGVTVVVDRGSLGGGTSIGCAPDGAGQAGSVVVPAAGFPLTYVSGEPFVCRISGAPSAEDEDCADTPPADAYWGLFWSDGDPAKWSYATVGITGLEVPEGGSIGWRWQDGGDRELPSAAPNTLPPSEDPSDEPGDEPSEDPGKEPSEDPSEDPSDGPGDGPSDKRDNDAGDRTGAGDQPGDEPRDGSGAAGDAGAGDPGAGAAPGPGPASRPGAAGTPSPAPSASPAPRRPTGSGATGTRSRRTAVASEERSREVSEAGDAGSGDRSDGTTAQALEPSAGSVPTGAEPGSALPWVTGGVLLALAAGAVALGRRRGAGA